MKPNPQNPIKSSEPVNMKKHRELESSDDNDINIEFGSSPKQKNTLQQSRQNTLKNSSLKSSSFKITDYSKLASSPVFMVPQNGIIDSSAGESLISSGSNSTQNPTEQHFIKIDNTPVGFGRNQSISKQLSKSQTDLNSSHDYGFKPSSVPTRGNYAQRMTTNVTSSSLHISKTPDNLSSVSSVSPPVRDFGMDFLFHLQAMRSSRSSLNQSSNGSDSNRTSGGGNSGGRNGGTSQDLQPFCNFKYMVLEGGGVKGVGLLGAICELYKTGEIRSITHITGSSVGAIIGSLIACKIPYDQLEKYIFGLDFSKFRDSSWNPFKNIYNIQRKCGWYQGNELYEEHGNLLRSIRGNKTEKPADITFQEIYNMFGVVLVIPVTLVYKQGCVSINCSRVNFPNMPVRLASRYSASFPLWFEALPFLGTLTTDGGLLNNYPVDVFSEYPDFATHAVGLKLVSSHENRTMRNKIGETVPSRHLSGQDILGGAPSNAEEFTYSIVGAVYDNAQLMHIPAYAQDITVNIDTGHISSMNFNISSVDKMMLFENGQNAMREFLQRRKMQNFGQNENTSMVGSYGSRRSTESNKQSFIESNKQTSSVNTTPEKNKKYDSSENTLNETQFLDLQIQK